MTNAVDGKAMHRSATSMGEESSESRRLALHEVELGVERLHRAHGHLVAFHHNIGRGMDHLADAEGLLRRVGYPGLADSLRDDYLPRGVITDGGATAGRWSYAVLDNFRDVFLDDIVAFGDEVRSDVANGRRHLFERRQEREWKRRSNSHDRTRR